MKQQPSKSDFTLQVTEDFKYDGGAGLSDQSILIIILSVLGAFCVLSIIGFVVYLRKKAVDELSMTETESRYLEIFDLRKQIGKVTKTLRFLDKRSDEFKENQNTLRDLNSKLDALKVSQVNEFMAVLETISFTSQFDKQNSGECSICMESYSYGETVYRVPDCEHIFHEDCLRNWLMSKN